MIDNILRRQVRERARNLCEYCRLPQRYSRPTHHIEHIVARQHGGTDEPENLALSCSRCNLAKGPNLTAVDPITGRVVPIFNPRIEQWFDHFAFVGPRIEGLTAVGRATARLLDFNETRRLNLRAEIIAHGELV